MFTRESSLRDSVIAVSICTSVANMGQHADYLLPNGDTSYDFTYQSVSAQRA